MLKVKKAYQACEEVIQLHSRTFHKAFSLLPDEKRQAVWAIYAFCRTVDDLVDEGVQPEKDIARFKGEFEQFLAGNYDREHFMWTALADVFNRYPMNQQAFHDMIRGQEMDLTVSRYETMEELLDYCYHVASTVGLMLLPVLAPEKTERLRDDAIYLGLAMQITNILRDVGEDLGRDRIYLPAECMKRYGLTEEMLKAETVNPSFILVWEHLAKEAEELYKKALQSIDEYPVYSRTPVKGALYLYRAILSAIRRNHYQVFGKKHSISLKEKKQILAQL